MGAFFQHNSDPNTNRNPNPNRNHNPNHNRNPIQNVLVYISFCVARKKSENRAVVQFQIQIHR